MFQVVDPSRLQRLVEWRVLTASQCPAGADGMAVMPTMAGDSWSHSITNRVVLAWEVGLFDGVSVVDGPVTCGV
jgi:hypothetical protein